MVQAQITLSVKITNESSQIYEGSYFIYNGVIIVTPFGGTAPYTFHITFPNLGNVYQNNGFFPGLDAGTYTITVTDATGKTATIKPTITYTYPQPFVSYSDIVNPSDCNSINGSFTLHGKGGTPPYLYSIDGGATYTTDTVFTNLPEGGYFIVLKDANGQLAFIDSSDRYGIDLGQEFNYCAVTAAAIGSTSCTNDGTIFVVGVSDYSPKKISFSLDSINYLQLPLDSIIYDSGRPVFYSYKYDSTGFVAGLYRVYLKDSSGNKATYSVVITKQCFVKITFIGIDASCEQSDGGITVIAQNGTPPYKYTIDGINYQTRNVFTGLASGNYTVGVKDASGSFDYSVATVYNKCPAVTARETDENCGMKNGTITATGYKGTLPYQFSLDGINFQYDSVFSNLTSGDYRIILKDEKGFTDSTLAIIYDNCIQLSLSIANTTCSNKNGSVIATTFNGTPPYSYSIDGANFQANNVFDSLTAGKYKITVKDAGGVIKDSSIIITDEPAAKIKVGVTNASCNNANGEINITASEGSPPLQYSIDNGVTFQSNNIFNNLDSGRYVAMVDDSNSCITEDTVQLTAPPNPKVFLGNDTTICDGQTVLLETPQLGNYQYLWQDNSTKNNLLVSNPGSYSVKVTNEYDCSASDTINVAFRRLPVFSIGNDTILCKGKSLLLQPTPLSPGDYLWNTGSTSSSLNINKGGSYWLQITNNGCSKHDSITIDYKPNPVINIGNDTTLCIGNTLALNATNNKATYLWQDGSTQPTFLAKNAGSYSVDVNLNGCDTIGNIKIVYLSKPEVNIGHDTALCTTENLLLDVSYPQSNYLWQDGSESAHYNIMQPGIYSVSVTNICGTTKASINVTGKNCACKFYMPNAFSPNGDGKNDVFKPDYTCTFSNYKMAIYNRWGHLIFVTKDPEIGWDGGFKNEPQASDVYVWVLQYKDSLTGLTVRNTGSVMLIR